MKKTTKQRQVYTPWVPPPRAKAQRAYELVLRRLAADEPKALHKAFATLLADPTMFRYAGAILTLRQRVLPPK